MTFFIYLRAGRTIYEKRKQLRDFHSSDADPISINGDAIYSVRTTEVTVTSEVVDKTDAGLHLESLGRRTSISAQPPSSHNDDPSSSNRAYSIHVTSNSVASARSAGDVGLPIQGGAGETADAKPVPENISSFTARPPQAAARPPRVPNPARRRNHEINNAAWSYTKCAILFFTAILVTWIPSSANRVFSVIHKDEVSVPLEFMSAFVLPLQGFWNAVIYAVTSWSACVNLMHDLRFRRRPAVTELVGGMPPSRAGVAPNYTASAGAGRSDSRFGHGFLGSKSKPSKPFDTESATELSTSRATSADGRTSR